jgi:hypothetical protein
VTYFDFSKDKEGAATDPTLSKKMVYDTLGRRVTEKITNQIRNVQNGLLFPRETDINGTASQRTFSPGSNAMGSTAFYESNPDMKIADPDFRNAAYTTGNWIQDSSLRKGLSLKPGDCPVVNPPWQWGELDDVRSNPDSPMVGRVYLNDIMSNYPVLILEPGRERYNKNPLSFFGLGLSGLEAGAMNSYIRDGGEWTVGTTLKSFLVLIKNVVLLPFTLLKGAVGLITGGDEANKFIRFKGAMKLYAELVNNMWRETAGNLRLMPLDQQNSSLQVSDLKIPAGEEVPESDKDKAGMTSYENAEKNKTFEKESNPDLQINLEDMGEGANNLFQDVSKGLSTFAGKVGDTFAAIKQGYKGTWDFLNLINVLPDNAYDGAKSNRGGILGLFDRTMDMTTKIYVPWLCTKSVSVSESFSNQTGEHPMATQMNQAAQEQQNKNTFGTAGKIFDAASQNGNIGDKVNAFISNIGIQLVGEIASTVSEMGLLINGKGRALFPEIWENSRYERNISVSQKFFAPYGDTITIFENVIAQYLMWLVLATPIQTAKNLYMSPFIVRAYSKGLFSCEFGMVSSLGVKRGEEKNDRSISGLPKTITLDIQIKDLAPVMMMSLGGGFLWQFRSANTALSEYLCVICGLTIADRNVILRKMRKSLNQIFASITDDFLNPQFWMFNASQSFILKPLKWWANVSGKMSVDRSVQYPGVGQ